MLSAWRKWEYSNMLRISISSLTRRMANCSLSFNQQHCLVNPIQKNQVRNARCSAPTTKRRKTFPYHWWPRSSVEKNFPTHLTRANAKFLDDVVKDETERKSSPLKAEVFEQGKYEPGSQRCGLIAKKIGQQPMWTKTGQRLLTTALQIIDNSVINYQPNEEFVRNRRAFYQSHFYKDLDILVVGAENSDPRKHPQSHLGLYANANVLPKKKLTRFFITPNAKLAPGTTLSVNHFRVGDYVDVFGKTRDHGFQGTIVRWKFRGQLKHGGVTKAHRRRGTIARGRKLMGPVKGTKMEGHMGDERRVMRGLKIWRINTKHNVIWVHGPAVPGKNGAWVYLFDTKLSLK